MSEGSTNKSSTKRVSTKFHQSLTGDNDEILSSIAAKSSVLLHSQVTLTCYIPTSSVGAVIGRRGSTILQIQRHAQQVGGNSGPVRVSIVGHEDEDVPYTYSELDWSSPHWTPVVIRASPCAALAAGQRLWETVGDMDEVVLDFPLARTKHASLIGKRGLVLANLSADTSVRIMVPAKEVRHDIVQLEGDLENVAKCLSKILQLFDVKPPPATIRLDQLPSQTKLRNVARKTETTIRKKKLEEENSWQLSITGTSTENIQAAVTLLERKLESTPPLLDARRPPTTAGRGGRGRSNRSTKVPGKKSPKPIQDSPSPSS
jgi:KH domain